MVLEMMESTDQLVRVAGTQIRTEGKWKTQEEVVMEIRRLKNCEVLVEFKRVEEDLGGAS